MLLLLLRIALIVFTLLLGWNDEGDADQRAQRVGVPLEIAPEHMPGDPTNNAGKALRLWFQSIEAREDVHGYNLAVRVQESPERFLCDLELLNDALAPAECEWAIPRACNAGLPHVALINSASAILHAEARREFETGDHRAVVAAWHGIAKLAMHASRGWSVVESLTLARVMQAYLDSMETDEGVRLLQTLDPAEIDRLWKPLEGSDPIGARRAFQAQAGVDLQCLRDGFFTSDHFVGVSFERLRPVPRTSIPKVSTAIEAATARILETWDEPDWREELCAARRDCDRCGYGWLLTDPAKARERSVAIALRSRELRLRVAR